MNIYTKCTYHLEELRNLSDNGTSFINEHWRNLAKVLAFTHIQSSPRNPRANGRIENVHNFLKRTMKKIRHGDRTIKWHEAIQIAAHYYNTFPSASNRHSPFLLHFSRECSNPLWNKLNLGNTILRQGDITTLSAAAEFWDLAVPATISSNSLWSVLIVTLPLFMM